MKAQAPQSPMPVYVIQETPEDFKIAYNMIGDGNTDMEMLLSEDKKRLHVIGKRLQGNYVDEFLWSFELPKSIDCERIELVQRQDFYLISIPKKNFLYGFHFKSHQKPHLQFASAI